MTHLSPEGLCPFNPLTATGLFPYFLKKQKTSGFLMFSGGIERDK